MVDADTVKVKASSVQKRAGSVSYVAANMLDGDRTTAWNSNGDKVGSGEGVVLTFTFEGPLRLRGVALLNGYQKTTKDGKNLYKANGRVSGFTVVTDNSTKEWKVKDSPEPQALEADLGETSTVTLTVTGVYPGN